MKKILLKWYIKCYRWYKQFAIKDWQGRVTQKAIAIRNSKQMEHYSGKANSIWDFMRAHAFLSIVIFPWVVCGLYMLLIETPLYESTAKVLIEKSNQDSNMNISIGLLGNNDDSSNNTYLTQDYIRSRDMMGLLEENINFIEYFKSHSIDFLSRLKKDPKQKDLLKYYQKKVLAEYDPTTKELLIATRAYDPDYAKKMLEQVLFHTRIFVNRVANTLANDQYEFAAKQLKIAKKKLYDAEKAIMAFQNSHGLFDPKQAVQVISEVMAQLKAKLVEKQTDLITLSSYMRPNSSKIVALKEEVKALKQQIKNQTTSLLGNAQQERKLNSVLTDYEWLQLSLKFATLEYEATQQAFDAAKVKLAKQQNLVIEVTSPNLPDDYAYPQISYQLINIFILLLMLFGLVKMAVMVVQEHRD